MNIRFNLCEVLKLSGGHRWSCFCGGRAATPEDHDFKTAPQAVMEEQTLVSVDPEQAHQTEVFIFQYDNAAAGVRNVVCHGPKRSAFRMGVTVRSMVGQVTSALPDRLSRVLEPLYHHTLTGKHLGLVTLWHHRPYLVRTYPVLAADGRVVAGILVAMPYYEMPDVTAFEMPTPKKSPSRKTPPASPPHDSN